MIFDNFDDLRVTWFERFRSLHHRSVGQHARDSGCNRCLPFDLHLVVNFRIPCGASSSFLVIYETVLLVIITTNCHLTITLSSLCMYACMCVYVCKCLFLLLSANCFRCSVGSFLFYRSLTLNIQSWTRVFQVRAKQYTPLILQCRASLIISHLVVLTSPQAQTNRSYVFFCF